MLELKAFETHADSRALPAAFGHYGPVIVCGSFDLLKTGQNRYIQGKNSKCDFFNAVIGE